MREYEKTASTYVPADNLILRIRRVARPEYSNGRHKSGIHQVEANQKSAVPRF